ncbi:MAG TPA: hypothetical protein VF276_13410 [Chloroflexia bacterium]
MSARGPAPTQPENELERTCAPVERAAWEAAIDRYQDYRHRLLTRAAPTTASEGALLARYRAQEQAAWDAYKAACRRAQGVAA